MVAPMAKKENACSCPGSLVKKSGSCASVRLIIDFGALTCGFAISLEIIKVAKKANSRRKEYSKDDVKLLKAHSKARTPVAKLSKLMKRSEGSLRQKARMLGIGLSHQR
jgi:RNase H-fold protein (predicted Holliday junction resolvase)